MAKVDGRVIEFAPWQTPFENERAEIQEVVYSPWLQGHGGAKFDLVIKLWIQSTQIKYLVAFEAISAFRVLDEHGLTDLWSRTAELGGRPGPTTFLVRNHRWLDESALIFATGSRENWSFVIATGTDCVEIVALDHPTVTIEI